MKYNILSIILLLLVGCQPSRDGLPTYKPPQDRHIICNSKFYMDKNATETWLEGDWIQVKEGIDLNFGTRVEFSYHPVNGKWGVFITSLKNPLSIIESSYKIEEDYWGDNAHRLISWIYNDPYRPAIPLALGQYPEIVKINEDTFQFHLRGFDLKDIDKIDVSNPDPKLAKRTFGDFGGPIYQRIKL